MFPEFKRKKPKKRGQSTQPEQTDNVDTESSENESNATKEDKSEGTGCTEGDMEDYIPPKSIDSLLIDPFEAKLPPSWKWLHDSGPELEATVDPISKTAVKIVLEHEEEILVKT